MESLLKVTPSFYPQSVVWGYDNLKNKVMITPGIKGHIEQIVSEQLCADKIGSGLVKVFATPMMIALMEQTCNESVTPYLEAGQGTVGTHINVSHCAATPVGMKVWCDSELIDVDRRRLTFKVTAFDEKGLIGEGTHERFIIDTAKFQQKTNEKR
jgi:predicted thioesterase